MFYSLKFGKACIYFLNVIIILIDVFFDVDSKSTIGFSRSHA